MYGQISDLRLLCISPMRKKSPMITLISEPTMPDSFPEAEAKPIMTMPNDIAGTAAMAICESLLLALNDHNILPEKEVVGILQDAAAAHENCPPGEGDALHAAVAKLINGILAGGNSVRHS